MGDRNSERSLTLPQRPTINKEAVVKDFLLPGLVAVAMVASGGVAFAQGHNHGPHGGGFRGPAGPSGGAFRSAPAGPPGGAMRSAPSFSGPRGHVQAPRSFQ